jgi:hypothetical protein
MPGTTYRSAAKWLTTALGSALIGASVSAYLSRPRIQVQLQAFTTQAMEPTAVQRNQEIDANPDLVKLTETHRWLPTLRARMTVGDYMETLKSILEVSEVLIPTFANLRRDLAAWPSEKSGRDAAFSAFHFFRVHGDTVRPHLWGEVKRQGGRIFDPAEIDSTAQPFIRYRIDEDGDLSLNVGVMRVPFTWSTQVDFGQLRDELQSTAQYAALSVAYGDPTGLAAIRKEIDNLLVDEASMMEGKKLAESELRSLSNWVVRVTVTNSGGRPLAISPRAALYLNTRGRDVSPPSGATHLDRDIRIELEQTISVKRQVSIDGVGSTETDEVRGSEEPIIIEGGRATSIAFRSVKRIRELPDAHSLVWLFEKDPVPARLALLPLTDEIRTPAGSNPVWSGAARFAEVSFEEAFPGEVDWDGNGIGWLGD